MIANITKGRGFGGAARYAMEKEGAQFLGSTFSGQSWKQIRSEVRHLRSVMVEAQKEAFHASLSLPKGEHLSDREWRVAASQYLQGVGMENTPHLVVRHTDSEHDHIHIVALRVDLETGKTPSEWKDFAQSERAVRAIEKTFGLTTVPSPNRGPVRPIGSGGEHARTLRTGQNPREAIQTAVDSVLELEPRTLMAFAQQLERHGVSLQPHIQSTGRLSGLRYVEQESGLSFKASKLGKAFGPKALAKYGVTYDVERDRPFFESRGATSTSVRASDGGGELGRVFEPTAGAPDVGRGGESGPGRSGAEPSGGGAGATVASRDDLGAGLVGTGDAGRDAAVEGVPAAGGRHVSSRGAAPGPGRGDEERAGRGAGEVEPGARAAGGPGGALGEAGADAGGRERAGRSDADRALDAAAGVERAREVNRAGTMASQRDGTSEQVPGEAELQYSEAGL